MHNVEIFTTSTRPGFVGRSKRFMYDWDGNRLLVVDDAAGLAMREVDAERAAALAECYDVESECIATALDAVESLNDEDHFRMAEDQIGTLTGFPLATALDFLASFKHWKLDQLNGLGDRVREVTRAVPMRSNAAVLPTRDPRQGSAQ